MKLIGVMGKTGSGKTTFTTHLEKKDNVGVIHVDKLVANLKKKYFPFVLQNKKNNMTENTRENPKLKMGIKKMIFKNKFIFKILVGIRNRFIEKELDRQIEDLKRDGKKVIIIDDWFLHTNKRLIPRLHHIYMLERSFSKRNYGLKKRDSLTPEEVKIHDSPYTFKYIEIPDKSKVSIIKNNGSVEQLFNIAEEEYKKLGELSFDEKYSLRGKSTVRSVVSKLGKVNSRAERNLSEKE